MTRIIITREPPARFEGTRHLDKAKVSALVESGTWGWRDLRSFGLAAAYPFVVPDGKVAVGPERFEQGADKKWRQVFDVEDAPAPAPPGLADYEAAIRDHLDDAARARGYDGILSAITYRDDPNPSYAAEGAAFFVWRSAVWTYAYGQMAAVQAGERVQPTVDELLCELPALVLL